LLGYKGGRRSLQYGLSNHTSEIGHHIFTKNIKAFGGNVVSPSHMVMEHW